LDEQTTVEGFDFAASPNCPRRSAASPPCAGCTAASWSCCTARSASGTHIAQALGHLAIWQGAEVRFYKTNRALTHLADGHADRSWPQRLGELTRPHVLILDDFAMRKYTAQQADDLYELISERTRAGRSLITTSNRNHPTGTRCSPTRSSPSHCWTGSSTPGTRSS